MTLIETVDLCQSFDGRTILKNINLKVERGEALAVIGPTGAGKTTLLRLIDLLDLPASGKIYFDGTDVTASGKARLEARRRMAFVLQKPVVFNTSVYANITCGFKWRGNKGGHWHQKVEDVLEMVDLAAGKNRNARTLSGGEAQRVAIARAIISEPEVLLLDEPTANLDPVSTARIEEVISNIRHQHQATIILATHDMSQGERLADRVGVLLNGEIVQSGGWREVFQAPDNRDVAEFVGIENIVPGVIASNQDRMVTIKVGDRVIEAISHYPAGAVVSACLRPEDITLFLSPVSSSARNSFVGEITRVVSSGPLSRIEVDCGFPLVALVTKRSAEELNLQKGKKVYATFKATAVHVIQSESS
ncbi:MAG TPA: ABC transporter ATP-binding protein [Dehalococcoidales bacterium]